MTSHGDGDDVGALFKSFGADDAGFRELARNADANEAEARWPLLKSIAPEKRDTPPALSSLQKTHIWNAPEKPAPRARVATPLQPAFGQKLAASLQQLATRPVPVSGPIQAAVRATAAPVLAAATRQPAPPPSLFASAPPVAATSIIVPPAAPAPLFASKPAATVAARGGKLFAQAAPAAVPDKPRGLFAQVETAQQIQRQTPPNRDGDSLASIFNRLAGNDEPVTAPSTARPSFLGRLGRR